jgi:polar amino acid transport system substrate-binding protein
MKTVLQLQKALLLIFFLLMITPLVFAKTGALTTSYYLQNIPPQLFFDNHNQPTGGILYDITHAIAQEVGIELEMLPIPRKRVEKALHNSLIDMHCVANPRWYTSKKLRWSEVLYNNPDVFINRVNFSTTSQLINARDISIGLTLGYVYPEINAKKLHHSVETISSLTPEKSYLNYRRGTTDGFISSKAETMYFNLTPLDSVVTLNTNNIHCAYSSSLDKQRITEINQAITRLKQQGAIDKILAKYQFNHVVH